MGLLVPDGDFSLDPDPGSMNMDSKHCITVVQT